jgi:N-acyl amino acid synthase of PEP-CTERM/exosortase system
LTGGFSFYRVNEESELRALYQLRYKSYCEEWGFERPEDHPEGLEHDEFDKYAVHFVATTNHNSPIGTIRLILNSAKGFPVERHCRIDEDLSFLDRDKIGEISRLAISKQYLRRANDRFMYDARIEYEPKVVTIPNDRRKQNEIVCGLYKCVYRESKERGLTHWYAAMSKGLYILLKRLGIVFTPIGPEVDYHGPRIPYVGSIEEIEREVARVNPELYEDYVSRRK